MNITLSFNYCSNFFNTKKAVTQLKMTAFYSEQYKIII